MSRNPNEIPGTTPDPLTDSAEKDTAGNPVKEILKEEGAKETREDEVLG